MWLNSRTEIKTQWEVLHPKRVLYDFDGPRIFTCLDEHDETWFAYQCDEQASFCAFLLVPFNNELEERLTSGGITILEALRQPRLWIAQTDHEFSISRLFKSKLDEIPQELLPRPEAMLWSHLQPLLNLRGIGKDSRRVVASVIRETVNAAENVLKDLLEMVSGIGETIKLRPLFDLPAQRLAFNSFEVGFRAPQADELPDGSVDAKELPRIYREVGELLRKGVELADVDEAGPQKGDDERTGAALRAIEKLSPSGRGPLQEIHISGQMLGSASESFRLSKRTRQNARKGIKMVAGAELENALVQHDGTVRAFDRDKMIVRLRTGNEDVFFEIEDVGSDLTDRAIEALQGEYEVIASGERKPRSSKLVLQAIHRK